MGAEAETRPGEQGAVGGSEVARAGDERPAAVGPGELPERPGQRPRAGGLDRGEQIHRGIPLLGARDESGVTAAGRHEADQLAPLCAEPDDRCRGGDGPLERVGRLGGAADVEHDGRPTLPRLVEVADDRAPRPGRRPPVNLADVIARGELPQRGELLVRRRQAPLVVWPGVWLVARRGRDRLERHHRGEDDDLERRPAGFDPRRESEGVGRLDP